MLKFGRTGRTALALFAAFAMASHPLSGASAQGVVVGKYGNWELQCDTPPGAEFEQCSLQQWVLADNRDNIGLVIIVLKTADQAAQLMRVVAPLGILLPGGVTLDLDGERIGRAEFIRCQIEGCYVEILLEDDLLTQLRAASTAEFTIFPIPDEGVRLPVSLAGFAEGFAALP